MNCSVDFGMRSRVFVGVFCVGLALMSALKAADWPAYRHDLARSGVTKEKIAIPLHRQWVYSASHAPRPAWSEPGRELNRLAFDYAYAVAAANGIVYFGSSADHKVYAIDLSTGRERWRFFTEGPVRFAPTIEGDRCFVASDDGYLYCLSAAEGKLLWRFYGGPKHDKIVGNGQLISRWPLRSGVGVQDGVVYLSAGMWPSEGVFIYALSAENGEVIWANATSGTEYVKQPHPGSFSMTGVAPQGYVLGGDGVIFVPTGRNVCAAYDSRNGRLLYYRSAPNSWGDRWGGSWNMLAGGLLFSWRGHPSGDADVKVGECPPDPRDGIVAFDAEIGKVRRDFPGKLCAVLKDGVLYASGGGKITAYVFKKWREGANAVVWQTPHGRAYSLIMAGDTLLVGGKNSITAIDARSGKQLWRDEVDGQVRNLAVADGRCLVSTRAGDILCYGPQTIENPRTISSPAGASPYAKDAPNSRAAKLVQRIIGETGKTAGRCLVLGGDDGRLLYQLAEQSDLAVHWATPDLHNAASARGALDAAGLYGPRVTVHHSSPSEAGFPDYFADLIIVNDDVSNIRKDYSAKELYRVLHPYGGVIYFPYAGSAAGRTAIETWLKAGNVPTSEIKTSAASVQVVRGELPGADDWTHQYANAGRSGASNDRLAKLPLKLLWFGEPGPARLVSRHWGGPAPLCVNGRMFVIGQFSLIAVDAYNGRELWSHDFRRAAWWPVRVRGGSAAADKDSVYLVTGGVCSRMDAATGRTLNRYPLPTPPPSIPPKAARSLKWSLLAVTDKRIVGTMGNDKEGKCVFALGKSGELLWTRATEGVVNNNSLCASGGRVYLIDATSADEIVRAANRGRKIKPIYKLLALDAATGDIVWQTEEGVAGRTALWLSRGVLVATSGGGVTGYDAASGKQLYIRNVRVGRFPVLANGTVYIEPLAFDLWTGKPKARANPFTGDDVGWSFHRSYGCGAISGGANLLMFRSGTLGFYDLAGDGGVYNFGGTRAGCYVNAVAADGLVLAPPSDAACTCSYSLRTTVALAPTDEERNWSIFYDRLPTTPMKKAAFNLGAPGDRRDDAGKVWLAMPRPLTRSHRSDIAVPFRFTMAPGFGPYRRNASMVKVSQTDRPWLYTSGVKGLQRAELDLEIFDRGVTSWPTDQPPMIDGRLVEPCWDGYKSVSIAGGAGEVTLRHDGDNLYVAFRRSVPRDAAGSERQWKAKALYNDAAIWADDSFELYFSSPARSNKCLHLGVSASGARYDASWSYVTPVLPTCDIPRLDVAIDGDATDWRRKGLKILSLTGQNRGEYGKMRAPADFDPTFRLGWSDEGLVMLARVKDNVVHEWENEAELWRGDSVEIFMTPKVGAAESFQCVVTPGAAPTYAARCKLYDRRKNAGGEKLSAKAAGKKTPDGYVVELLLPWKNLNIKPEMGREFGVQIFANDDDMRGGSYRFRALLHPSGDPRKNPFAYQAFRLAAEPSATIKFERSKKVDRYRLFTATPPYRLPIQLPTLGAYGEDAKYAGVWPSAVRTDQKTFSAEIAIPWKTLTEAGFDKGQLMVALNMSGPLRQPPKLREGFERLIAVPESAARPRALSLRLHFAEVEDVKPGERVFDVKLQGKVVLKDFDVVKAAGAKNSAVVKEFKNIVAARALTLELIPKAKELTVSTAPVISGIEITSPEPAK